MGTTDHKQHEAPHEEIERLLDERERIESRLRELAKETGAPEGADPEEIAEHDAPGGGSGGALAAELEEYKGRYQRALADFQNFQRRAAQNEARARVDGAAGVMEALLPALDNLELALRIDAERATVAQVVQGFEVIRDQVRQALSGKGLSVIEPAPGEEFDPSMHEAMMRTEAEGVEAGRVASMLQVGYRMGERVLRPAKVAVAEGPAVDDEQGERGASGDASGEG